MCEPEREKKIIIVTRNEKISRQEKNKLRRKVKEREREQ